MSLQLLDGLARHLAAAGHGVYRPDSVYAAGEVAIVLNDSTPEPEQLVVLRPYPAGPEPDSRLPFDEPYLQVRRRGTADSASSAAAADALYGALHGLGPVELHGGLVLMSCIAIQTPTPLGRDDSGRYLHVFNVRCEHTAPTAHRPA